MQKERREKKKKDVERNRRPIASLRCSPGGRTVTKELVNCRKSSQQLEIEHFWQGGKRGKKGKRKKKKAEAVSL